MGVLFLEKGSSHLLTSVESLLCVKLPVKGYSHQDVQSCFMGDRLEKQHNKSLPCVLMEVSTGEGHLIQPEGRGGVAMIVRK